MCNASQLPQRTSVGASIFNQLERRLSRRAFENLLFGFGTLLSPHKLTPVFGA